MKSARLCCLCLFNAVTLTGAVAQRFPDRFMTINPLADQRHETAEGINWMHSSGGWGEFGAYRLVRDQEHAWVQRLGAYIEMFRIDNDASLAFIGNIEFIANPHNNIRFNPRAIFWEEGFFFTGRSAEHYWQVGYFHRCKHDIDNFLLGKERTLIFGSLQAKYLVPFTADGGRTEGLFVLRTDVFTIRQDDREPQVSQDLDLNRAIGSAMMLAHFRQQFNQSILGLYLTGWGGLSLYSGRDGVFNRFGSVESAAFNGGFSGGVAVHGNAHFRIGLSYEYVSDTGIDPVPGHAHLLSVGVTIVNPASMW